MINKKILLLTLICLLTSFSFTHAAVIITIDTSNPEAVIFAATGAAPLIDDSSSNSVQGITLLGFFNSAFSISMPDALDGNLVASEGDAYLHLLNGFGDVTTLDLNIYAQYPADQVFSTLLPAFSGSSTTIALSEAQFGTSGNIIAGDTIDGGAIIGQWAVIPESNTYILLFGLIAGAIILFRRSKLRTAA